MVAMLDLGDCRQHPAFLPHALALLHHMPDHKEGDREHKMDPFVLGCAYGNRSYCMLFVYYCSKGVPVMFKVSDCLNRGKTLIERRESVNRSNTFTPCQTGQRPKKLSGKLQRSMGEGSKDLRRLKSDEH